MSWRVVRVLSSGGLISVGPNTIPRFSAFIKLSFSFMVTLQGKHGNFRQTGRRTDILAIHLGSETISGSQEAAKASGDQQWQEDIFFFFFLKIIFWFVFLFKLLILPSVIRTKWLIRIYWENRLRIGSLSFLKKSVQVLFRRQQFEGAGGP